MSIRWYQTASELVGSDNKMKAGRFELIIARRDTANGKPRARRCEFVVCGTTDAAVDAHAVHIAEKIATGTTGALLSMKKIMGHYRKDAAIPIVASNRRLYGILGYSPTPATGLEAVNMKVFVPFWNSTIDALQSLHTVGSYSGATAQLGVVRWADQEQTELEAAVGATLRGASVTDMSVLVNEHLVSDDVAEGVADGVLGPQ